MSAGGGAASGGSSLANLRHRRLLLVVALLVVAATAGCGIPLDSQPVQVPVKGLPEALQPSANTNPSPPPPADKGCSARCVTIYFFDVLGDLSPVTRRLQGKKRTLQGALDLLAAGPTQQEANDGGYYTFLPQSPLPVLTVSNPSVEGVVYVTLDPITTSLVNNYFSYALGQIVYTLDDPSEFPAVHGVEFLYYGAPYPALLPDGEPIHGAPVDRADYASIAQSS